MNHAEVGITAARGAAHDAPPDITHPDADILTLAADLMRAGRPFVMVTVTRTQGSTPREAGARLLWQPEGEAGPGVAAHPGGSRGTIGGGQFEHLVLDAARECFARRESRVERLVLGAESAQCCGGVMEVFIEYHGPGARLVVFGAGHVAHELARLVAFAGLDVVIVDDRPEWNSAARFAGARRVSSWQEGLALCAARTASTIALVMTCSHDTDFDVLHAMLSAERGRVPAVVGLIGSRSKRACLFSRLVASGVDEARVQRVRCPIGVLNLGKQPQAIAISVAAQVLNDARLLAAAGSRA